jgi:hypothetical protein
MPGKTNYGRLYEMLACDLDFAAKLTATENPLLSSCRL